MFEKFLKGSESLSMSKAIKGSVNSRRPPLPLEAARNKWDREERQQILELLEFTGCPEHIEEFRKELLTFKDMCHEDFTENRLKAIGIPMGPRTRIMRKLKSQSFRPLQKLELTDIIIDKRIEVGHFGGVYTGLWQGSVHVALKTLHREEMQKDFIDEATILKNLRHPNVVNFYGIFDNGKKNYLVFELMTMGSLLRVLRQSRQSATLTRVDLLSMATQVAVGMIYLSSKNMVHRDLAARNLLVQREGDRYVVKITDFGLTRVTKGFEGRMTSAKIKLPLRWTAPESMTQGIYSSKSDVYSFGIVLYEIMTLGREPWEGLEIEQVPQNVVNGEVMNCPSECPPEIYELMKKCWQLDPKSRPTFKDIFQELRRIEEDLRGHKIEDPVPFEESDLSASGNIYGNNPHLDQPNQWVTGVVEDDYEPIPRAAVEEDNYEPVPSPGGGKGYFSFKQAK